MAKKQTDFVMEKQYADFVEKFSKIYSASDKSLHLFDKFCEDGYFNFCSFFNTHNKTNIVSKLESHPTSNSPHLISLYDSFTFYDSGTKANNAFNDNSQKLLDTLPNLLGSSLSVLERESIVFLLLKMAQIQGSQKKLLEKLTAYPKLWGLKSDGMQIVGDYILAPTVEMKKINNISELIKTIKSYRNDKEKLFFRGHSNTNYRLLPSVYRTDDHRENETKMYQEILIRCPKNFLDCKSVFEHLVEMQHYELPTRLLDLTTNPLVALYCACDSSKKSDGEIILISNKSQSIKYSRSAIVTVLSCLSQLSKAEKDELREAVSASCLLDSDEETKENRDKRIEGFNKKEIVRKLLYIIKETNPSFRDAIVPEDLSRVIFVNPQRANARISKQEGLFMLAGLDESVLNNYRYETTDQKKVILYIPSAQKGAILDELVHYGISEATIYPEIEHIAKFIKNTVTKL